MKKRTLLYSLLMAMVMMAISPQSMWAWGGSGTSGDPYTIKNVSDLIKFANIVNGENGETQNTAACAKLTANIHFDTTYDPYWNYMIGSSSKPYTGTFDGQGYKITNMRMSYRVEHAGMFAYVTDATIKNFSVEGGMSSNKELTGDGAGIGTIVGRAEGATKILDVASSIGLAVYYEKQKHIGGILGYMGGSTQVSGCTYSGTLDVGPSNDSNGGIVGFATNNSSGSITNCMCTGTIISSTSGPTIGGILGYTNDESNNFGGVQNCFSSATLTITGSDKYANAIVGRIRAKSHTTINNTFLSGTATRACNEDCAEKVDFTKNYAISINVTAGSGGKVTNAYRNPTSTRAPQLQVKATPNSGYHFVSWSDNNAQNHYVALTSNVNLNATFGAHTYGAWITDKNATCTTTGSRHKECTYSGCTEKQTSTLAATGHGHVKGYTPTYEWAVYNRCTFSLQCNDCTESVVNQKVLSAQITSEINVTCTTAGSLTYTTTASYSATGDQDFSEEISNTVVIDPRGHNFVEKKESSNYRKDAATCTKNAVYYYMCSYCSEKGTTTWEKPNSMLSHSMTEHAAHDATCTNKGNSLYYTCSQPCCANKYYKDNDAHTTDTYANLAATVIDALGHSYTRESESIYSQATCAAPAYYYYCCERCAALAQDADHVYASGEPLPHQFDDEAHCPICGLMAKAVYSDNTLTFYYDSQEHEGITFSAGSCIPEWGRDTHGATTTVVFDPSFASFKPNKCRNWFNDFRKLETVSGIEYLNTEDVTDMAYMFYSCLSLKSLDVSKFNTKNVTDMACMFYSCSSLKSLDVSKFNTKNVKDMSLMFLACSSLESLNLKSFNVENVTDISGIFHGCSSLKSIEFSNFNMKNAKSVEALFSGCKSLKLLDLSGFNTQNVEDMANMFNLCEALESLDLSSFNTENVKNMSMMFYDCTSLKSLDLSSFNTENVKNMSMMFRDCKALQSLDLRNFNTQNVTLTNFMFQNCTSLKSLDLSNFDLKKVEYCDQMFEGCSSLQSLYLSNDFTNPTYCSRGRMFYECGKDTPNQRGDIYYVTDSAVKDWLSYEKTQLEYMQFVPSAIIKDGVPFINTSAFETESDNVVFTRTFTPDKPSTLMLPFSVPIAEVLGVSLYEFQGRVTYNDETNEWETYVTDVTDIIEANKPYIAVPYLESLTFRGEYNLRFPTTAITAENMVQRGMDEDPWQWSFVGLNEFKRWEAGDPEIGKAYGFAGKDKDYDDYSVAQGEFVKIAAGASAKPGRCYLVKNDGGPLAAKGMTRAAAADELPSRIKVHFINGNGDNTVTGIAELNTETGEMSDVKWYDLNGRRIEKPSKGGIYIKNNKKVLVK